MTDSHFIPIWKKLDISRWMLRTKIKLKGTPEYKVVFPISDKKCMTWDISAFRPNMKDYLEKKKTYFADVVVENENSLNHGKYIMYPKEIYVHLDTGSLKFKNIR